MLKKVHCCARGLSRNTTPQTTKDDGLCHVA
jgi:hypothetical protein